MTMMKYLVLTVLYSNMSMRNQTLIKYLFIHMYDSGIMTEKEKKSLLDKYATVHNLSAEEARFRINNITL